MSPLHVAIDCRVVDPRYPGIGRATLETVRAFAAGAPFARLSLITGPDGPPPEVAALESECVRLAPVGSALRQPSDQWALPRLLRALRPDLYHATYYAVPALVQCPLVVTVYDLIPRLFPHYWPGRLTRGVINAWTAHAVRTADRVVVSSFSTADDVARFFPAYRHKARVVPLGVTPVTPPMTTAPHGGGDRGGGAERSLPYLLYVGSNKPHKNLPRLVRAFARVAAHEEARLVIAGAWDDRYPEACEEAERLGLADRVQFEHRPSDARLAELYRGATAFVFPSRYEGFGLPVLEAMAAGLPVVTSDGGSLGEVAGGAALLVDPDDADALAAAMRRLLDDGRLRQALIDRGRDRAARYPWSRTAAATWRVYEEIARGKG